MKKITSQETTEIGIIKDFEVQDGMSDEENKERVLRNNIISSIRLSWIDSEGYGRDCLYFPIVKIIGKDAQSIIEQVKRYKELRKKFVDNQYEGIKFYDKYMKEATNHVNLVGLNQNKLLEGIIA